MGIGIYHSAIEIHGFEYEYGGNPNMFTTGVFKNIPKRQVQQMTYKCSILLGKVKGPPGKVYDILEEVKEEFRANEYNVLTRNCNHFTDEFARRLLNKRIPKFINRMALLGSICSCLLPPKMKFMNPVGAEGSTATMESSNRTQDSL